VTTVTITPHGETNIVDIIEGETQTFTCTTDSSRPAAWIQWYIGGQNVTNQAASQQPQQDGDKFISSSSLVYTGRDVDQNKVIFCEAVNIQGGQKAKSTEKSVYIQCKYYFPYSCTGLLLISADELLILRVDFDTIVQDLSDIATFIKLLICNVHRKSKSYYSNVIIKICFIK
jgi:hypothetical protein